MNETDPKPPFWKTDAGKSAFIVLTMIFIYPFIHKLLIQEMAKGPAPDFQMTSISNKVINLKAYQGQPVLLHFWATWCEICEHERPDIERLAEDYAVINIAIESGSNHEVRAFIQKNSMNSNIVINDEDNQLKKRYRVIAVPASFVIDSAGEISFVKHGYSTYNVLSKQLDELK